MDGTAERMTPEFALTAALDTVPVLKDADGNAKVAALQPRRDWRPPFVFYIPTTDEEEKALDGLTGLQDFAANLHCVAGTHRGLLLLCQRVKKALQEMTGWVYVASDLDPGDDGLNGRVLIEDISMEQSSPDLVEMDVGYYRRIYTVRIQYQTEEVPENDD